VFIVAGKRTPFGKFGESLKDISPVDLTVLAGRAVLDETKISPKKIDHSILANVTPSTTDTIYAARHVALKLGAKVETPAYNVNRLCGSGFQAIVDASHYIKRGEASLVLASGVENMSMVPHLVYGSRFGTRFGPIQTVDMLMDSLTDKYAGCAMAITAENLATDFKISREECDQFGFQSHQKAAKAFKDGHFQGEIARVAVKKKEVTGDEHVRHQVSIEDMTKLKATFKENGTVTAGTASGIVDGAGAVLVASQEFCNQEGLTPLAEVVDYAVVGVDPTRMGIGPSPAIKKLLKQQNLSMKDIDLFEINEAFAAQTLAVAKDLSLDQSKLNVWGGAIAIGHPLGASGIRICLTLARQLKHYGLKNGIGAACIGGGQGIAVYLRAVK
jgi:acetyl-CoA C-acetyltransferase/acetyl-CoA acyltransferase 2